MWKLCDPSFNWRALRLTQTIKRLRHPSKPVMDYFGLIVSDLCVIKDMSSSQDTQVVDIDQLMASAKIVDQQFRNNRPLYPAGDDESIVAYLMRLPESRDPKQLWLMSRRIAASDY
jgi:hypothetical protein